MVLVTRMDISEVYAPMREKLWMMVTLVGALLIGSGGGVGLAWRRQFAEFYGEKYLAFETLRESEQQYRRLFENMVEGFAHCQMLFENGKPVDFQYLTVKDALERFQENQERIRLVLCDVIMPRMSGSEVRDAIKKLSPHTPIIFMSGYPDDIIQQKSLLDESEEIIHKPFSPTTLIKKVREALDRQ
jgi:CheY-like chemotaxis protein